ncbi:MAG: alpha-ketoacid dehydrogenase subunit beta [bacterium]|nr:alpha-ketoacid dehydrogenase subunit beta [bacterium]MDE0438277.1 alpha-ketoacid dehydrogenase subunit beta [bacterium]
MRMARAAYFMQAMHQGLRAAMEEDETVIVMGEDVDRGVFGVTRGLIETFGANRIRKTPISEAAFVGAAVGAAAAGLRPFAHVMFSSFFYVAMDQVANQAARLRYMSGGQVELPIVYFAGTGPSGSAAAQHSENPHSILMHTAGLKVVMPSTPYDAKGLMIEAIRDRNPVVFLADLRLARRREPIPGDPYAIPLGVADVKREGEDVTVVALASLVHVALDVAGKLDEEGISVEVIDPRSLVPFDWDTIVASVRKTGRLVVADPARRLCGLGAEVVAGVSERAWDSLRTRPRRVTWPDIPVPFSPVLEERLDVGADDVEEAIRATLGERAAAGSA